MGEVFYHQVFIIDLRALDRVGLDVIEQSFMLKCMRTLKLERKYI
jgi:hypothetical protein